VHLQVIFVVEKIAFVEVVNVEGCVLVAAAKLGRRSHKMRELISEATRTVEDSQTAQALHGLLSLKSPADCPPSATSTLLTSVAELSMEVIQQTPAGLTEHQTQVQAAGIHSADTDSARSPTKTLSQPAMTSKSVDRHATLRAAILSPGATGLQPATTGAAGSAVQILLQMQQDDAAAAAAAAAVTKAKPLRAKLTSAASAGNVSIVPTTSSVGINTTHMLLDRSVPVRLGAPSSTTKATAASSVPLSSVIQLSDSSAGQAVPIQLIATSQGVLAIPNYKLIAQNAMAAVGSSATAVSTSRVTQPAVVSPTKRRVSSSAHAGGLLKVAKLQTPVTQSPGPSNVIGSVVQSEPVAASMPHPVNEIAVSDNSSSPNHSLQTAIRDSYEKLFWKVYLQSSSFQSMPRPPNEGFNGNSEVSFISECSKFSLYFYCAAWNADTV